MSPSEPLVTPNPHLSHYLRDQPDLVRSFLAVTARAYEWAAAHPAEAAEAFLAGVAAEHADVPLPKPLDPEMVRESQVGVDKGVRSEGWVGTQQGMRWNNAESRGTGGLQGCGEGQLSVFRL